MKKLILLIFVLTVMSCEKDEIYIEVPPVDVSISDNISDSIDLYGDSSKGLEIYLTSTDINGRACVNCHLSPTGVDIVQFGKINLKSQDSIVVKRSVEHITLEESYHIAAYLRTLNVTPNDNGSIATMIGIDNSNGVEPSQVWDGSTSLTINEINNWDFRNGVTYDFGFPRWFEGDENNDKYEDNLDWLPEIDLLTEKGLSEDYMVYLNNPTNDNLKTLLYTAHNSMSEGERNPGEHGYYNFEKSFDYQRWMATLYMQHVIAPNSDLEFGEELSGYDLGSFSLSDGIWDVGNIARRCEDEGNGDEINNRLLNEVQWLYLGWLTNYGKRNSNESQYIGRALRDYGESDLASLVILKSLISRSDNSQRIYDDIHTMTYITSDNMLYKSLKFGLTYILDGLDTDYGKFKLTDNGSIYWSKHYFENDVTDNINNSTVLTQTQKIELTDLVDEVYVILDNM